MPQVKFSENMRVNWLLFRLTDTRMAAVIAHPIRHSISPFIHNLAYELTATNAADLAGWLRKKT